MSAARLVERSIRETDRWLDRLNAAGRAELHVSDMKTLIDAWRAVIGVGRQAFRLDEPPAHPSTVRLAGCLRSDPGDAIVIDIPPDPSASKAIGGMV